MEEKLTRRMALSSLGLISSGLLVSGCGRSLLPPASAETVNEKPNTQRVQPDGQTSATWNYLCLDAKEMADRAYAMYPGGGCMYSMVGSVISALAERVGEPFRQFPYAMMRYGEGGIAKWGSLCGVVNGAAALIGLFYPHDQETRERLIGEFAHWYESTELPIYSPPNRQQTMEIRKSVAGSILCHLSVGEWCKVSGQPAFSKEKSERCRRLTADGVAKLVSLLNEAHAQATREVVDVSSTAKECNTCHGRAQLADAMVKMDCRSCHDLGPSHAVEAGQTVIKPDATGMGPGR